MGLTDNELTLGVLFKGRVDNAFRKATDDLKNIIGGLSGSLGKAEKSFDSAGRRAKQFGGDIEGVGKHAMKTTQGFQRLANSMKFIAAYGVAARVIWGTVQALQAGTQAIIDYDQALKNLQAITSATDVEILALGGAIREVAQNTKFSATEVAEAAILLGQAGFSAAESMDAIGAVANLSTGTLTSMANSADLLTTAIRAFGLEAQEANRVSDVFASAVNRSKLTIDKLRIAFNYLGPVSNQVGLSLEDTAAGAMLLANAGLRASTIGTGFRRVLQQLVKPTEKMKLLIAATGGDIDKLNPSVNEMTTVFDELQKILGKNVSEAERSRRAFELFGLRGASVAAAFAQAGAEGFRKMYEEVLRSGTAAQMAEKQMEGLGVMLKNLKDRLQVLAIAVGEGGIADAFRFLIPILRETINLFTIIADSTAGRMLIAITSLTVAMAGLRLAIRYAIITMAAFATGNTIAAMKTLALETNLAKVAVRGLAGAWATLTTFIRANPWLALFAAVATVSVALLSYKKSVDSTLSSLRKTELEHDRVVGKLETYRMKLEQTEKGTIEYKSVLERLVADFPDLADKVDLLTGKWRDQGEAFDELIQKYRTERFKAIADTVDELSNRLEKSIKHLQGYSKSTETMQKTLKALGSDLDPSKERADNIREAREEVSRLGKESTYEFEKMASAYLDIGGNIYDAVDEITNKLINDLGFSAKEAEKYSSKIFDSLERMRMSSSQQSPRPIDQKGLAIDQRKVISQLEGEWLKLYDTLSEERKIDLYETVLATQEKIDKMREEAEKIGLTEAQIDLKRKEILEEALANFKNKETEKEKRARQTVQNILSEWKRLVKGEEAYERQALENWFSDQKAALNNNLKDQEGYYSALQKLHETYRAKQREIDLKYDQYKPENQLANEKYYHPLNDELAIQREIVEETKRFEREILEISRDRWEEQVRMGEMSVEEYHELLERARQSDLISYQEYAEKKAKINDNAWYSFVKGWESALKEVKTLSEQMYDLGSQLGEKLSTEFTDAFGDFIDGTKSAKDAFADMASDMLSWMAKMLMQWAIMRSFQDAYTSTGYSIFGALAGALHSGGIAGSTPAPVRIVNPDMFKFAPRFHSGLMPGEYPAILKKGEGVFTPEQMKALGSQGQSVTVNSNVTVNMMSDNGERPTNDPAQTEMLGRNLSRVINERVNENIRNQLRPGGIIDQHLRSR
ncbi:MAG: phage tail tape measure protein [Halobacteriota archaeon]|nr:phage tail tape measure protein [Halobacteriota archaeon]